MAKDLKGITRLYLMLVEPRLAKRMEQLNTGIANAREKAKVMALVKSDLEWQLAKAEQRAREMEDRAAREIRRAEGLLGQLDAKDGEIVDAKTYSASLERVIAMRDSEIKRLAA